MLDGGMGKPPPPRTVTTPQGKQPPHYDGGPDLIIALRERGRDVEHALLPRQATFTLGRSPHCDVVCKSEGAEQISSLHADLERRGQRLRVIDRDSRNGTFFQGHRENRSFDIGPGDLFTAATTDFLALNEDMVMRRPYIAEVLGLDAHAAIDDVEIAAVKLGPQQNARPLLIVGEAGCEPERLADEIHRISVWRKATPVVVTALPDGRDAQRDVIDRAKRSTMIVKANGTPIDEVFLTLALSPSHHVRLIVVAPSVDVAAASLGLRAYGALDPLVIRPMRDRRDETFKLLDRLLVVEQHASVLTADLRAENRAALAAYRFPGNLAEVRDSAKYIAALAGRSIRAAVPLAGVAKSTLSDWIDRLNLSLPLFPKDFEAGR